MDSSRLADLMKPQAASYKRFLLRIDGMPKTGKTILAYTASKQCPHPSTWNVEKPVELTDILGLQFEENSTLSLAQRGIKVANVLDWTQRDIDLGTMKTLIKNLPAIGAEAKKQGIHTVVVDTLSTFNRFLLQKIVEEGSFSSDMERIRAYGDVDSFHYLLFDNLLRMGLNVIGLVHLQHFAPFGEEGGGSSAAAQLKAAAAKQVDKQTANLVQGIRTDFIPELRPKVAGHWARLADAVLVAKPTKRVVRAGESVIDYKFITESNDDYSAGGRWKIPPINDSYLRPIIEARYTT